MAKKAAGMMTISDARIDWLETAVSKLAHALERVSVANTCTPGAIRMNLEVDAWREAREVLKWVDNGQTKD